MTVEHTINSGQTSPIVHRSTVELSKEILRNLQEALKILLGYLKISNNPFHLYNRWLHKTAHKSVFRIDSYN